MVKVRPVAQSANAEWGVLARYNEGGGARIEETSVCSMYRRVGGERDQDA